MRAYETLNEDSVTEYLEKSFLIFEAEFNIWLFLILWGIEIQNKNCLKNI